MVDLATLSARLNRLAGTPARPAQWPNQAKISNEHSAGEYRQKVEGILTYDQAIGNA